MDEKAPGVCQREDCSRLIYAYGFDFCSIACETHPPAASEGYLSEEAREAYMDIVEGQTEAVEVSPAADYANRLTTAEAERDAYKARAERAEEAGLALLEFIDSPEVRAESSWAAVHGYRCDHAVSSRNAETIETARAALEASKP